MDSALIGLIAFLLALIVFDLIAYRFGANSRPGLHDRPDW